MNVETPFSSAAEHVVVRNRPSGYDPAASPHIQCKQVEGVKSAYSTFVPDASWKLSSWKMKLSSIPSIFELHEVILRLGLFFPLPVTFATSINPMRKPY